MHLPLDAAARADQPAAERVDRDRDEEVQQDAREKRVDEDEPRGARLTEHEVEGERCGGIEDGHDRDGEERRVRSVTPGRLAVAADPVPRDRQQQRVEAQRAERRSVEDETGEEPAAGSEHGAAEQRDADERDEHEVGLSAQDIERADQ